MNQNMIAIYYIKMIANLLKKESKFRKLFNKFCLCEKILNYYIMPILKNNKIMKIVKK